VAQLFAGWAEKAQTLGVREYYSVNTWDRDLPGAARGGNLSYLCETLPRFHAAGARYVSAESSDNFGPNGLGYHLAARVMWDVRNAARMREHVAEFLELAFGPARSSMHDFYELLDSAKRHPLCDDLLGRMYRHLAAALDETADPAIRRRIFDLALYTRHVELFSDYSAASGTVRQQAFEALIRHAWRIRHTGMIHTLALYRDLVQRDKSVTFPPHTDWKSPDKNNPWKQDPEYTPHEILSLIQTGVQTRPLLDFTPVAFSDELVPASPLKLSTPRRGNPGLFLRGVRDFWTFLTPGTSALPLRAAAGLIYANRGNARIEIYPRAEPEGRFTASFDIPPTKDEQEVRVESSFAGLHRVHVSDQNMGTRLSWPEGTPMTLLSDPTRPPKLQGRWTLYAYVPRGTPFIGGFSDGIGDLLDPAGRKAFSFPVKPGYFRIPVPEGADGKLWCFSHCTGDRLLMTIPPCLAADATELLLPAEVIARDSP
jgi:hypothetical protein